MQSVDGGFIKVHFGPWQRALSLSPAEYLGKEASPSREYVLKISGTGSKQSGSVSISGKLPTYPSLMPTLTLTSHLGHNVDLREG